ncbi:acyltransferase family protein [Arthrobacter sp. YD2]|uniref:acyltransferase family protein n=1 Tax=Arthrobacter sp. YD2 TaxID=3058046 RepID=UPI0025B61308|nr:acyltransferase family protein [Arthrobacter sp. YD2]MDN3903986.1 acyltransferase family protein [Arthrobacter sp. YD2]
MAEERRSLVKQDVVGGPAAGQREAVSGGSAYRPEIQGLRALAVLMVVTYHIWFGRVSGGVDVFLLISAFLLSLSFIRKVERGRPLALAAYWIHVFKRLLPAVVVVLLGTLAATYLFVPQSRWMEILQQAWSSLLYFQNWVLAANSVDYYAADHGLASPLQHFWSLSIQGQVFILWPLLFALAAVISQRARLRFRPMVALVFGAVFLASFIFSIVETYGNQAHAYFDTRTRLWEFALGTLLAVVISYVRLPRVLRVVAGWAGLALMLSVGFVLDVQGQFPGYVALMPLGAAMLVIVAGQTGSRIGADRFLSLKPLMKLGEMSYALYLWHWPVLVVYLSWRGRQEVGAVGGTAIILLSLVLAYLTTRFVEKPLRAAKGLESRKRAAVAIAVCVVLVGVPLGGWQYSLKLEDEKLEAEAVANYPGARVLQPGYDGTPTGVPVRPASSADPESWGELQLPCSEVPDGPSDPLLTGVCFSTENVEAPERTILVIGSSHAQQWLEAIEPMAESRNYRVLALLRGGCSYTGTIATRSDSCNQFNEAATEYALDLNPDAVVAVATSATPEDASDPLVEAFPDVAEKLTTAGIQVVGIRDNPRFAFNMQVCAESNGPDACVTPLSHKLTPVFPRTETAGGMVLLDFSDLICPEETCRPIVGNTYVYLDDNHLTTSYAASMAPEFERRFHDAVGW